MSVMTEENREVRRARRSFPARYKLDITHKYDEKNKTIELTVRQTQSDFDGPTFRIPTKVDIYLNGKKETKIIDVNDRISTFYFPAASALECSGSDGTASTPVPPWLRTVSLRTPS